MTPKPRALLYWLVTLVGTASACRMDYGYLSEGAAGSAGQAGSDATSGSGGSSGIGMGGTSGGGEAGTPTAEAGVGGMSEGGTPAERRTAIISEEGRIVPDSNDFGIDGEWRPFGADPDLLMTVFEGEAVCIKGTVLGAKGGDVNRYWGGGLQLVLHDSGPNSGALRYDATEQRLGGLVFTLLGGKLPAKMRLKYKQMGTNDNYCVDVVAPKAGNKLTLQVEDAKHSCWLGSGAPVDASNLENFEIHIVPETPNDIEFNFCVHQLTAIPAATE